MIIGILTYHWVANFGANLQAVSSYRNIKALGHEPILINWIPSDTEKWYIDICGQSQLEIHQTFISSECKMTRVCRNSNDIRDVISEYKIEYVVIGSDSLWNIIRQEPTTSDHRFPNPFWGEGIVVPHASLSVSCQNARYDNVSPQEYESISSLLSEFDFISVRDSWTKLMANHFTDKEITITPDPVFAYPETHSVITKSDLLKRYGLSEKYVLFSFKRGRYFKLHRLWLSIMRRIYNRKGIMCVNLSTNMHSERLRLDKTIEVPINPNDWYYLIKYSEAYIGVMMHPIIVCLHNSVPFYSFDHYGIGGFMRTDVESSKIYHIVKKANLLKYYQSLKNNIFFPSPWKLINALNHFPKEECTKFADAQREVFVNTLKCFLRHNEP